MHFTNISAACALFCGAGQVATILHNARISGRHAFDVHGIGRWHPDDTKLLTAMLIPRANISHTPHRLVSPSDSGKRGKAALLSCASLHPLPADNGAPLGTTRVIRIYENTGDHPALLKRIDWELPYLSREGSTENPRLAAAIAKVPDVPHIVIKDLGKGAVTTELVKALAKHSPHARWYVSSKDFCPKWLEEIPKENLDLLLIPQLAAQKAIEGGSYVGAWMNATGEPSFIAMDKLEALASRFEHTYIVIAPQGLNLLCLHERKIFTLFDSIAEDNRDFQLIPMASVLFPALVAQIAHKAESDVGKLLQRAASFTSQWSELEVLRFSKDDWEPDDAQDFKIDEAYDANRKTRTGLVHLKEVRKCWNEAFNGLGIVKGSEFHLWRGMTEIDGYVACIQSSRAKLLRLLSHGRSLMQTAVGERHQKSFLIVDAPGSGKSYLAECLATTLRIPYL